MTRIILDTDLGMGEPGSDIDDGFALALAVADPGIDLELVTTVNGNADVDTATRLTRELLVRLGRPDVAVVRGAPTPLVRRHRSAGSLGVRRPEPDPHHADARRTHAATEIVERVMAEPGELTIVAIGPLTNLALALCLEPAVATAAREIVVMGGVYLEQTNVAAMPGEFNFWVDPEAADIVLESGGSVRLVGLDVTRRVRLTRDHAVRMGNAAGEFSAFAAACTHEWIDHLERTVPGDVQEHGSCPLHDPLAVGVVIEPDLVTWRPAFVAVETAGERTRGVAVADLLTTDAPPEANCAIATAVDSAAFMDLFLGRMESLA